METIKLTAEERKDLGTTASKNIRKKGLIPCVLCSKSEPPCHLTVRRADFEKVIRKGSRIIDLQHSRGTEMALIKEVQYDHLGEDIYHIDFNKVAMDEWLTLQVPLILKGKPVGVVDEAGTLDQYVRELKISCLPANIPHEIVAEVGHLKLNQNFSVKELKLPEGIKVLQPADLVIAAVTLHVIETAATAAAEPGAAEPEVIKKEPKAEDAKEGAEEPKEKEKEGKKAKE